jgi:hypothetical protein
MRLVGLAALCLATFACQPKTSAPAKEASVESDATSEERPEARFWKWFAQNAAALRSDTDLRSVMERISEELAKVDKGVFAEIGSEGDQRLLVLSVDGDKKLFPVVERLYAARPKVAGWKIVAFRQRDPELTVIEMDGKKLDPGAMKFVAKKNGEVLDVVIYVPNFTSAKALGSILFVALDHTVGEYDAEMRIGGIEWAKLESAPADARPFAELPKLIDRTFPR